MPTLNPRITFTVSDETMKAIDEYRFSHRMRNQTQAILSLIDLGFKVLDGNEPIIEPTEKLTDEDRQVLLDGKHFEKRDCRERQRRVMLWAFRRALPGA